MTRRCDGYRYAQLILRADGLFELPDGQITEFPVQSLSQKYSASPQTQIKSISVAVPAHRGAFRDRHKRWARDAVDADALLTNGADADGEVVWS
jgi:hypothetical protein